MTYEDVKKAVWWDVLSVQRDGKFNTDLKSVETLLMKVYELGWGEGYHERGIYGDF